MMIKKIISGIIATAIVFSSSILSASAENCTAHINISEKISINEFINLTSEEPAFRAYSHEPGCSNTSTGEIKIGQTTETYGSHQYNGAICKIYKVYDVYDLICGRCGYFQGTIQKNVRVTHSNCGL